MTLLLLATVLQDVDRLILDLAHDDVAVRDAASLKLIQAGVKAAEALERASKSADAEVAARAGSALRTIRMREKLGSRVSAAVIEQAPEILELLGAGNEEDLLAVVRKLRGLAPEKWQDRLRKVGTTTHFPAWQISGVFQVIWERIEAARKAGAPMSRLEEVFLAALFFYSNADGDLDWDKSTAVPTGRLLQLYLAPRPAPLGWEAESALRGLLQEAPPFESPGILEELLKDPSLPGRELAVQAAGTIGLRSAVPRLRKLLDDEDFEVRAAAASSLGTLGDVESIPKLSRHFFDALSAKRFERSQIILKALVQIEAYDQEQAVIRAIHAIPDEFRPLLAQELIRMRPEALGDHLVDWMRSTPAGGRSLLVPAVGIYRIDELDDLMGDLVGIGSRHGLATALINAGRVDLSGSLLEGCREEPERQALVQTLCEAGVVAADEAMAKALESGDPQLIRQATPCKSPKTTQVLLKLASHENDQTAAPAIDALCRIPGDLFEKQLPGWLASERIFARRAAVWGAANRGTRVPLEIIEPLLKEKDGREAAITALVKFHPDKAREPVEEDWKSPDLRTRKRAAEWMGEIDEARAIGWMRTIADTEVGKDDLWMRNDAAVWLAERGDPKPEEMLKFGKVTSWYRSAAFAALARGRGLKDPALLYRSLMTSPDTEFDLNKAAAPDVWKRYQAMPMPAGIPPHPTLDELVTWLAAHGVPVRWHPGVRPLFKVDRIRTDVADVLELLKRIHMVSAGTRVHFEPDGAAVLQTALTSRRAWFEWWDKLERK